MAPLTTRSPLDGDVAAIASLIGDARIVAIGENNHHVREFGELRARLLRRLVEDHGFTVLGFESGFAEGDLVQQWLSGGPGTVTEIAREGFTFSLGESVEVHEMLTWMRSHGGVRFAGLDLPSSSGSPQPALQVVRSFMEEVDPEALTLVDAAITASEPYSAVSNAVAPGRYAAMSAAERDAATAALTTLLAHLRSLSPVFRQRTNPARYAVAEHHAVGALRVDAYLRELTAMMSGTAPSLQGASRDTYMAATVKLLRQLYGEGEKIVVMVHNGHLQRVPFAPLPNMTFPSAGTHLAAEFGDDYFALGLTAGTGTTTGLEPDESERLGFRVFEQELEPPVEGSVEAALAGAGPCVVDLRQDRAQGQAGPSSMRHAHMFTKVDVVQAFDALVYLPTMSVSAHVPAAK
ncbi:erythromycin esterase family protein [Amycolatopsis echigonensis]|uniref:Erythromycin esterase n=1 Tax=Amycolatopsis echigonensis TaxID=2576905 RepID=A0A2N3WBB6_9PSEU|nr:MULTISPECIES: erythromycin esterase family protein [Amycolatopsis]MBB2500878.1 erythromycin esterase family protein [Amycolatopsis echigonensis]PKV91168.1 erythromycin esterase [Amycolatopsis niigatensis]